MAQATKYFYQTVRQRHQLDAAGQSVGRLATQVALLLRGKNKATYSAQTDSGDLVEVINVDQLKWTGNKLAQREYIRHTNHPGGLRREKVSKVFAERPAEVLRRTVYNMLPVNHLRPRLMKRLTTK